MKKLESVIRPHLLDAVRRELRDVGVSGVTVSEVKGVSGQTGRSETYRRSDYGLHFVPKVKIEAVLEPELLQAATAAIRAAGADTVGDERVFVSRVDEAISIGTGERGRRAL